MKTGEPEERRRGAEVIVPERVRPELQTSVAKNEAAKGSDGEKEPEPIETLRPKVPGGAGSQIVALAKYMAGTEVHTYAFSVAANVILSLFPFIVLLLTITRQVFHSTAMESVVGDMMRSFLPVGQDFIVRNMQILAHPRKGTQVFSLVMLLVTSTGVFLPLEVALNNVWGVTKNRNYLHNQAVSLGLAFAVGALSMISVALSAGQQSVVRFVFFGHTDNVVFRFVAGSFLHLVGGVVSILLFFLIYWALPNRQVPARAVLPTAIVVGLAWEGAKVLYILALPWLDFQSVYGPFYISVGLMMWAFLSGLLLLAGAHFSATRYTLALAREAEREG
ncbi:YihY family inner membrane protein [Granulicella aggregans]|jgi:membrane protein|uniref:YihY family inner membrane protein n=1 Tax=Granulicella aggregans TaxID=474949 RepID=A0A7W7ZA76_9BACT|nr:YihY/virulence factor BrkB family protein [Granulicella aggregans]MBB5056130.1 YihY family inner membrane protein [Granulicella aggregans]